MRYETIKGQVKYSKSMLCVGTYSMKIANNNIDIYFFLTFTLTVARSENIRITERIKNKYLNIRLK